MQGQLPEWLGGTYLLNGPAEWDLPKRASLHGFDGLAMLHGFRIQAAGRWWNVGVSLGRECEYVLFSSDAQGRPNVKARIPVKRSGYLHAFALTATHAVIWECAWRAHPLRFLFASESYAAHFDWLPEGGSCLHAVRLSDGTVRSWDAPPLMLFHASQAFDAGADVRAALALEPLFVPRPGGGAEDDGVLLVHTLADADLGSRIRVLDAVTLVERAVIELPHVIPFGFYGAWKAAG